jgi:hypothetical protein
MSSIGVSFLDTGRDAKLLIGSLRRVSTHSLSLEALAPKLQLKEPSFSKACFLKFSGRDEDEIRSFKVGSFAVCSIDD